jgi:hypothetical protein
MKNEIIEYIRLFSNLSVIIPLIFYLKGLKTFPLQNHIIGLLIFASGLTDFLSYSRINTSSVLYNVHDIIQFFLLMWFYYELVYKKKSDLAALIGIGIYVSVLLFSILKYGFFQYYSGLWSVGAFIVSMSAFVYIFNIPRMIMERYFDSNLFSNMILNVSLVCYFVISFMIFYLMRAIYEGNNPETENAFWSLHNIFNILKNIGLAIGFYYTGKRKIYMTMEQLERIARKLEEEK